jgi:hypothetical protein
MVLAYAELPERGRYAIRCCYFHQGIDEFDGPGAVHAPPSRITFTVGKNAGRRLGNHARSGAARLQTISHSSY